MSAKRERKQQRRARKRKAQRPDAHAVVNKKVKQRSNNTQWKSRVLLLQSYDAVFSTKTVLIRSTSTRRNRGVAAKSVAKRPIAHAADDNKFEHRSNFHVPTTCTAVISVKRTSDSTGKIAEKARYKRRKVLFDTCSDCC